ncbi:MAG: hypothetical protein J1F05_05525 [Muribaculaceae bacterium]|nr:hypothetical protein [Muribaculaceae bacterium]
MKKKILGLALIAVSMIALPSVAQNTDNASVKTNKEKKVRQDKKVAHKAHKEVSPFDGLNLSDSQKSQLQELNKKRANQRKEDMKQAAKQRHENDSTLRAQRLADRKAYLADVKAIIGADQYVVFLENFYLKAADNKASQQVKRNVPTHRAPDRRMAPTKRPDRKLQPQNGEQHPTPDQK